MARSGADRAGIYDSASSLVVDHVSSGVLSENEW